MKTVCASFYGPYPLWSEERDILLDCPCAKQGGIYLWTVKTHDGQYRISYIGQTTRSFYDRTKEHLINQLGGLYNIYDAGDLRQGNLTVLWGGLWGRGRQDKLPEYQRQFLDLAPHVTASLKVQHLFVAPLDIEKRLLNRIEGAIASTIRECAEASSLLPSGVRYRTRNNAEDPIKVLIEFLHPIQGLPAEMEA